MATVRDVAKLAGVSLATVSRVLNGSAAVSPEISAKVLAAVKEVEYQPNAMAQGLRLGRGTSVALLVGDIEQSLYATLTKHIQAALTELGLDLLLYNLGHREDRLLGILERAPAMRLRGVIIATPDVVPIAAIRSRIEALVLTGIHVLSIGQRLHRLGAASIVYEERTAVARSVRHLIDHGRTPVAYLGRITGSAAGRERFAGYRTALGSAALPVNRDLVWDVAYRYDAGYEALTHALDQGLEFKGIQAGSDELALGATAAILDRGLHVPDDIAVVGFGDIGWSRHVRPALTTLSADPQQVAERIREILQCRQEGRDAPMLSVVPRALIRRQSA